MRGQGAARRLGGGVLDRLGECWRCRKALGFVGLQCLDGEFELLDASVQSFGRGTELRSLETGEFERSFSISVRA